jgi:inositol hexakisphosphate/diphosphoinositol-pentakisphosphate kinase
LSRVKLPKSFLAVNLSESHTFHKKEETGDGSEDTSFDEMKAKGEIEEKNTARVEDMDGSAIVEEKETTQNSTEEVEKVVMVGDMEIGGKGEKDEQIVRAGDIDVPPVDETEHKAGDG